jgi:hypothetical protein
LLDRCAASVIEGARELIAYHDCLLFLLAYPQTAALHSIAERELRRVAAEAKRMAGRRGLDGSGVAWSEVGAEFSYPIAGWLQDRYPDHADLDSVAEGGQPLQAILKLCMPGLEETLLTPGRSAPLELLDELRGNEGGSRLRWLVAQLKALPCSDEIREHLFETLKLIVSIRPGAGPLSRTFARGLPQRPFYHRGEMIRRVDSLALIGQELPPPSKLSTRQRVHLIDAARATLAMLRRETEPITLCEPDGVEHLDLGRGVTIAMFWMPPGRRLPLDTHVGFVLFKNALPVAYGGGWPFLGLCRIGVNIFEPYRGGESAYLFCQVLRVYHQRFETLRFLVESFQFGDDNTEGIESGAFWFYHRLGFRPVEPRLARLAEEELARTRADRAYRSPRPVLRRLARSDMELVLPGGDGPSAHCDPADLSRAVSERIEWRFAGDRTVAQLAAFQTVAAGLQVTGIESWPESERRSFLGLCLLLALVPDLAEWPAADKRSLVAIMRAKGAKKELRYFELGHRHRRFREAMAKIALDNTESATATHMAGN